MTKKKWADAPKKELEHFLEAYRKGDPCDERWKALLEATPNNYDNYTPEELLQEVGRVACAGFYGNTSFSNSLRVEFKSPADCDAFMSLVNKARAVNSISYCQPQRVGR